MTAVSSTNTAGAVTFNGINYSGALTPDALMAYCQSRLKDIDGQMNAEFAKQKDYNNATTALNAAQTSLEGASTAGATKTQIEGAISDLQSAAAQLPDGNEQKTKMLEQATFLQGALKTKPNAAEGDVVLDATACKHYSDTLTTVSKDLGTSAELDMMTLQSLMSQRQTAIQMCTNMIGAEGDTEKAIAQKVGG